MFGILFSLLSLLVEAVSLDAFALVLDSLVLQEGADWFRWCH